MFSKDSVWFVLNISDSLFSRAVRDINLFLNNYLMSTENAFFLKKKILSDSQTARNCFEV